MEFCKWLSDQEGATYRLPTEAEWEMPACAGTTTAYFFGNSPDELGNYAWYAANSTLGTHPVAQKLPNPWGLYDMLGNVWQRCSDWYNAYYYKASPPADPPGPATGIGRIQRGGSFRDLPATSRCATCASFEPASRSYNVGFRVAREPVAPVPKTLPAPTAAPIKTKAELPTITNSIGLQLTLIPAGEFTMGSPEGEVGGGADERPQHPVRITRPFYLGTFSVTKGQFAKFVAATNHKTDAEKDPRGGWGYDEARAGYSNCRNSTGATPASRRPTSTQWLT